MTNQANYGGADDEPVLLTVDRAVRRYSVGKSTLYAAMKAKELAAIKLGGRRLIRVSALEEWIDRAQHSEQAVV